MSAKAATPITGELLRRRGVADAPEKGLKLVGRVKKVGVRLDVERYVKLRTYAAQHDLTGEEVLVAALDAYLKTAE
jgi:hypothetical protein